MNSRITYAQNLLLSQRRGRTLTPAEKEAVADTMDKYGPETIYMDGELFAVDI